MHPDERPRDVRELRRLLFGTTGSLGVAPTLTPRQSWGEVLRQNRLLIGAAAVLVVTATLLSLLEPPIAGILIGGFHFGGL